jgi:hypothetical protein
MFIGRNLQFYGKVTELKGRVMAQAVSRRSLIGEARVCVWVSPYGICVGQNGTGTDSSPSSPVFPANLIPPRLSMLMYHLADEK